MKNLVQVNFRTLMLGLFSFIILSTTSSFTYLPDNADAIVGVWKTGEGNAMLVSGSVYAACKYYELFQNAGFKNCAICVKRHQESTMF